MRGRAGKGLSFELDDASGMGFRPGETVQGVPHGEGAFLLLGAGHAGLGYFAGTLDCLGLAEVVGPIVSGVRSGILTVQSDGVRKTISFREGQVVFAASTADHERLGTLLVREGLVSAPDVERAAKQVGPEARLGQVLVRSGRISPAALYSAMTRLVRRIVLGLFEVEQGQFLFAEAAPPPEDAVKLPERTRDLLLEGFKRAEALAGLRSRFPLTSKVRRGAGNVPSHPELLEGTWDGVGLAHFRQRFPGSEYEFLSWVEACAGADAIHLVPPPRPEAPERPSAEAKSILDRYRTLIATICRALQSAGKGLRSLQSFFEDPLPGMEQAFRGVALGDDGQIDLERVVQNLSARGPARGRAEAYEAVSAFVSYALFAAKNDLPPELAGKLARELKRLEEGGG